jgi:hypothetical protein
MAYHQFADGEEIIGDDMNRLRRNLIGNLKGNYCLGSLVIVRDGSKKLLVSSVYVCGME